MSFCRICDLSRLQRIEKITFSQCGSVLLELLYIAQEIWKVKLKMILPTHLPIHISSLGVALRLVAESPQLPSRIKP
jgi:hypothetical protein